MLCFVLQLENEISDFDQKKLMWEDERAGFKEELSRMEVQKQDLQQDKSSM